MATLPIDAITFRKVALSKQIYQRAFIQAFSGYSYVDRIMSVIGFDLAVETLLKALVVFLDSSKNPENNFPSLWTFANDLLLEKSLGSMPDKVKIFHVHSIRNDAQHKARYPNELDVRQSQIYVGGFLAIIVNQVWGISFESLTDSDLINNEKVRDLLIDARSEYKVGNLAKAVSQAAIGLFLIINPLKKLVVGSDLNYPKESDGHLVNAVSTLQETLLLSTLGINFASYAKYREIAGNIRTYPDGSYFLDNIKEGVNDSDTEFVITFCCDTIIQVESIGEIRDSRPPEQMSGLFRTSMILQKEKSQERIRKEKKEEEAEKNRELFRVKFVGYDKQTSNLCEVEFSDGGIGYAILEPNSSRNLVQEQQLLYARVKGHQYGYLISTL